MPSRAASTKKRVDVKATLKEVRDESDAAASVWQPPSEELLGAVAEAKKMHPGMIVLFRRAANYAAFGDDVVKVLKILGKGEVQVVSDQGGVNVAEFAAADLEKNLGLLLRAGERVAVCEPESATPSRIVAPPEADAPIVVNETEVRTVRLEAITVDADLNPRHELNQEAIADYAESYKSDPKSLPKPILFDDGSQLWLASGYHRTSAASDAGLESLECEIRKGTRLDALVFAAGENTDHGVKRTTADKKRAVANILRSCPDWTPNRIAKHVKVSHPFVADVKKDIFPNAAPGKLVGLDGKKYSPKKAPGKKPWRDDDLGADVVLALERLIDVQSLCESIELMSADDPDAVQFALTTEDEAPEPERAAAEPPSPAFAPPAAPAVSSSVSPAGNWKWTEGGAKSELDATLVVESGIVTGTVGTATVDKGPHMKVGTYASGSIEFDVTAEVSGGGEYRTKTYTGKMTGPDSITGTIRSEDGAKEPWAARRINERIARDMLGRELPYFLKPAFTDRNKLMEAARFIANGAQALSFADKNDFIGGYLKTRPHIVSEPKSLAAFIRRNLVPYCVCPICDGDGDSAQCPTCGGKGWLSRRTFDEASEPARERAKSFKPGDAWEGDDPADEKDAADSVPSRFIPAGPGLDPTGHEIPPTLRDLFAADWLQDEARRLDRFLGMLRGSTNWLHWLKPEAHAVGEQFVRLIRDAIPFAVCRACNGNTTGCGACKTSGYIPKYEHENLQAQDRAKRSENRTDTAKNKKK